MKKWMKAILIFADVKNYKSNHVFLYLLELWKRKRGPEAADLHEKRNRDVLADDGL